MGWDWTRYDAEYDSHWALSGRRRCWDEVAVLARLVSCPGGADCFARALNDPRVLG